MNLSLRNFTGTMAQPLLPGDRGVAQTIRLMRDVIEDAVKDSKINALAIQILRAAGVDGFDRAGKLRALYDWVKANILYVEDPIGPFGPKETIRPVRATLDLRAGDCDDFTNLFAALAGTIGFSTEAVTIAADPSAPEEFSHIYPMAEANPGEWIALDAARPGAAFGVEPPYFFRKRVWSLTSSEYEDLAGVKPQPRSRLNGYVSLGQYESTAAQDIAAIGQSVANVAAAAEGNPYASYATAYSPYSPPAGYPAAYGYATVPGYPSVQLTASGTPSAALIVGGIILFAILARGGRW